MGWSCRKEQGDTLDKIQEAMGIGQFDDGELVSGRYFMEAPSGGPYGKDYGTDTTKDMVLPVLQILNPRQARRVGYARIHPDGSYSLPRGVRQAIGL